MHYFMWEGRGLFPYSSCFSQVLWNDTFTDVHMWMKQFWCQGFSCLIAEDEIGLFLRACMLTTSSSAFHQCLDSTFYKKIYCC